MDRLWAIRKDFDSFGGQPPRTLVSIFRCTVGCCPYCNWIFTVTWGVLNPSVGPGERKCWHCKLVFLDGSQEWKEMSSDERLRFLLPVTVSGYIAVFLLIGGLELYTTLILKMPSALKYSAFLVTFALPVVPWFCFRALQVYRSVHRYNARENTPTR